MGAIFFFPQRKKLILRNIPWFFLDHPSNGRDSSICYRQVSYKNVCTYICHRYNVCHHFAENYLYGVGLIHLCIPMVSRKDVANWYIVKYWMMKKSYNHNWSQIFFNLCQQSHSLEWLCSGNWSANKIFIFVSCFAYYAVLYSTPIDLHFEKGISLKYILHYVIYFYYYFAIINQLLMLVWLDALGSQRSGDQELAPEELLALQRQTLQSSWNSRQPVFHQNVRGKSRNMRIQFYYLSIIIFSFCSFIWKSSRRHWFAPLNAIVRLFWKRQGNH